MTKGEADNMRLDTGSSILCVVDNVSLFRILCGENSAPSQILLAAPKHAANKYKIVST